MAAGWRSRCSGRSEPRPRLDLAVIRLLAQLSGPFLPLNLGDDLTAIVDEFGQTLFREIDYELEADNAERFAQLFENDPTVVVPEVSGCSAAAAC